MKIENNKKRVTTKLPYLNCFNDYFTLSSSSDETAGSADHFHHIGQTKSSTSGMQNFLINTIA